MPPTKLSKLQFQAALAFNLDASKLDMTHLIFVSPRNDPTHSTTFTAPFIADTSCLSNSDNF